eukprot:GEMP01046910.1.p1 GENE.GEMP01046910.1~~GEMP01046910.1.p1  ORF type:complete len:353 (+),score=62.24 GEMP01046910.1:123-1181(+)
MPMQWLQHQWSQEHWTQQQWPSHQQQLWKQPPQQRSVQGVQIKEKGGKRTKCNNVYIQALFQRGMDQEPQYHPSQRTMQGQKGKDKNASGPCNQTAERWIQSSQFKGQQVAKCQKGKGGNIQPKVLQAAQGRQLKGKGAKGKGSGKGAKRKGKSFQEKIKKWKVREVEHRPLNVPPEVFPELTSYDNCLVEKHLADKSKLGPSEIQLPYRIVAVTACNIAPKYLDDWIDVSLSGMFNFSLNVRTAPLGMVMQSFDMHKQNMRLLATSRPACKSIKNYAPATPTIIFAHDRKQRSLPEIEFLYPTETLREVTFEEVPMHAIAPRPHIKKCGKMMNIFCFLFRIGILCVLRALL